MSDRDVERLFVESRLGWFGRRIEHAVRTSWLESRCRSSITAFTIDWRRLDATVALRAAGWTTTVAALTTLIVQRLGGERVEPATSVVPIVAAAGGLVLCVLAGRRSTPDGRHGS
jgi:hypothetical protein